MRDEFQMRIFFVEWNAEHGKLMIDNLSSQYDTVKISRVLHRYKTIQKYIHFSFLKKLHTKAHAALKFKKITKNDLVICTGYSALAIIDIVATIPCKKIIIVRDTIEKLNYHMRKKGLLTQHESYLGKIRTVFNNVYSFDQLDCINHNMKFLPQFISFTSQQFLSYLPCNMENHSKECFYVGGYDTYRADTLNKIYSIISKLDYNTDFYLVTKNNAEKYPTCCKNVSLSYQENLGKIKNCEILVEINRLGQAGLTLRALEALFFNKKLITTNIEIKKCDFYSPDRIFIWDVDSIDNLATFMNQTLAPIDAKLMKSYTADTMIEKLINDNSI